MKHCFTESSAQQRALSPGALAIITVGVEAMRKGASRAVHA